MNPRNPFPDRVNDQTVYARCLKSGNYDEGLIYEGQTFRVGHTLADGSKLTKHPYPAVRMEYLRSRGEAERVLGGTVEVTPAAPNVETAIQEVRAARAGRRKEAQNVGPLPDANGGLHPVPDGPLEVKGAPQDR